MKVIRWILGKMILGAEAAFPPRSVVRTSEEQAILDQATSNLVLYQFATCPFCVKVRREAKRLGLSLSLKDALPGTPGSDELVQGGGDRQVPCLRISNPNGSLEWMYESASIVDYLRELVAQKTNA